MSLKMSKFKKIRICSGNKTHKGSINYLKHILAVSLHATLAQFLFPSFFQCEVGIYIIAPFNLKNSLCTHRNLLCYGYQASLKQ